MKFKIEKRADNLYYVLAGRDLDVGVSCWTFCGLGLGYKTLKEAKQACLQYKQIFEPTIVEEYILEV